MRKLLLLVLFPLTLSMDLVGQTAGDYRSRQTGNWTTVTTWQVFNSGTFNNLESAGAGAFQNVIPSNTSGIITISDNTTITIPNGQSVTADQIEYETNGNPGTLSVSSGGTLTVADGTGDDIRLFNDFITPALLQVAGTLILNTAATIVDDDYAGGVSPVSTDTYKVLSGGLHVHSTGTNVAPIPAAQWQTGSTCRLDATSGTVPTFSSSIVFYNFIYNGSSQSATINLNAGLRSVTNDLTITTTNGFQLQLGTTTSYSLTVGRDLLIGTDLVLTNTRVTMSTTGSLTLSVGRDFAISTTDGSANAIIFATTGSPAFTVTRNFSKAGSGTLSLLSGTSGTCNLNLSGDFTLSGGTITRNSSPVSGNANINFNGASTRSFSNYSSTSITNAINIFVNTGKTLNMGSSQISGTGTFSLAGSATLGVGSADGLTIAGTGLGNIITTGTRTYATNSTIVYNSNSAQNLGDEWSDALAVNTVNLEIANTGTAGVTNNIIGNTNVVGVLTLTSSSLNIGNSNTLQIQGVFNGNGGTIGGDVTSNLTFSGSGTINGNLAFKTGTGNLNNFTISRSAISNGPINLTSSLNIAGTLAFSSDVNLIFNGTTITISGDITQTGSGGLGRTSGSSNIIINGSGALSKLPFAGSPQFNNVTFARGLGSTYTWNNAATVTGILSLNSGTLTHSSGLTMAAASLFSLSGGAAFTTLAPNAGGAYDVSYTGGTLTSGLELPTNSTNLRNLTVAANVTLGNAVTVNGALNINSGTLAASTHDVTLKGTVFAVNGGSFTINSGNLVTFSSGTTTVLSGSTIAGTQFGNLLINSGTTVSAPNANLNVSGTWTNGGIFTANSGKITFNGGAQNINPNGQAFFDVEFAGTGSKTLTGQLDANGTLTITSTLDVGANRPINVAGSWVNNGTFICAGGLVTFNGTTQSINPSGQAFFNLTIATSGTKTLSSAVVIGGKLTIDPGTTLDCGGNAISIAGDWANNGIFDRQTGTVTFNGTSTVSGTGNFHNVTITGALIAPASTLDVSGNWTQSSGSFTHSGGTLAFSGNSQLITPGSQIFNNVIVSGTNNKTLQGPADINGNLTISAGTFNVGSNQQVNLAGNFNSTGGALNPQNGLFVFDGGAQNLTSAGQSFYWVRLTGAGSKALQDSFSATNNLEIFSSAALNGGSNNITVGGYWDATGGSFSSTGTTFLTSNTGQTIKSNGSSFGNLTINGGGTKTLQDALDVNGNLTLTSPLSVSGSNFAVNVGGNWDSASGAFNPTGGTVTLDGAAQDITIAAGGNFFNLTIAGSGTKTQQSDVEINGSLLISSGALSAGSDRGLSVAGNWTNNVATGGYVPANGSVTFDGGGTSDVAGTGTTDFFSINVATPTNLEIENNANLYGTLTLVLAARFDADGSGNAGVFTVKSTSQTAGGLIAALPNPTFFIGNVTIERFVHGQAGGDYRFVSMPIKTGGHVGFWKSSLFVTGNFSDRSTNADNSNISDSGNTNPSVFTWNSGTQAYVAVDGAGGTTTATSVDSKIGYAAYDFNDGAVTASYRGVIETGTVPISISNTNDNFNLIPNPYPAPIDWDAVTKTGVQNAMYLRTANNTFSSYVNGSATLPPYGGWTGEVGIGQSFWTKSDGSNTTLTLKEGDKAASARFVRVAAPENYVRVQLKSSTQTDEAVIRFITEATDANDARYDAAKRRNGNYVSALGQNNYVNISSYNTSATKDFAINSIGKIEAGASKTVYLKIFDVQPGSHSLKFMDISTLSLGYKITLIDHFLNKKVDVADNMTYTFTVGPHPLSFGDSRFELRFQGVDVITAIEDMATDETRAYPNPVVDKLYVKLSDQDEANLKSIVLIDVLGNVIVNSDKSKYLLEPGIKTIEMSEYSSGFYILNVQSGDIIKSIRVIKK